MVGSQVGAYRVLERIGQGGMGTIWRAEHVMLGRRAALKLLHPPPGITEPTLSQPRSERSTLGTR